MADVIDSAGCDASSVSGLADQLGQRTLDMLEIGNVADFLDKVPAEGRVRKFPFVNYEGQIRLLNPALFALFSELRSEAERQRSLVRFHGLTVGFRTLIESFVLYRNGCKGSFPPGESAEELGLAVQAEWASRQDVGREQWLTALANAGFYPPDARQQPLRYLPSELNGQAFSNERELVQETNANVLDAMLKFTADSDTGLSSPDARLSVAAFQTLWNLYHPEDLLTVSGIFDAETERRLLRAPANGFRHARRFARQCPGVLTYEPFVCVPETAQEFILIDGADKPYLFQHAYLRIQKGDGPLAVMSSIRYGPIVTGVTSPGYAQMDVDYRIYGGPGDPPVCDTYARTVPSEDPDEGWSRWRRVGKPAIDPDWGTSRLVVDAERGLIAQPLMPKPDPESEGFDRKVWQIRERRMETVPALKQAMEMGHVVELRIRVAYQNISADCTYFDVYRDTRLKLE